MIISNEERVKWRKEHTPWHGMSMGEDSEIIVRLLDALETEERVTAGFNVMLESSKVRAEAAERERDALLEIIADQDCPYDEGRCDKKIVAENSEETMCRQCWLKWLNENHGAEGASA